MKLRRSDWVGIVYALLLVAVLVAWWWHGPLTPVEEWHLQQWDLRVRFYVGVLCAVLLAVGWLLKLKRKEKP